MATRLIRSYWDMKTLNRNALFVELAIALGIMFCLGGVDEANAQQRTRAENWVVKQVRSGAIADLKTSPYKKTPQLSASFLEKLLTGSLAGVQVHYHGVQIKNAVIADRVDLRGANIPFDVSLAGCVFESEVDCSLAHFKKNLFLPSTRFAGKVDFTYAEIENVLMAEDTRFESSGEAAVFQSLKVGREGFFARATFSGRVDFGFARFGGDLIADGVRFQSDHDVAFNNMRVGGNLYLGENVIFVDGEEQRQLTIFKGGAMFDFATVGGNLVADKTAFEKTFSVRSLTVTGDVNLEKSVCNDLADFSRAKIGGNLDADEMQLEKMSDKVTLNADSLTVMGHILLRDAVCKGVADFRHARTGGDFEVSGTGFDQPPNFFALHVGDSASFDKTRLSGIATFTGMTYQLIDAGDAQDLENLFNSHSEYSADVYANLEDVFRRHGEITVAKSLYVAGKQRERSYQWQKHRSFMASLSWAWDFVQDKVAGYGRHLERALYCSVVFIIFGCFVFWKERWMETQDPQDAKRYKGRYRPIWYSLALFLPIVELPDSKVWMPQRNRKIRRFYMRVHVILGYLLIPIGVAAWTGIIK